MRAGSRILAHGHSRVVLALLRLAVKQGIQFSVVVTEGRVRNHPATVTCVMHSCSHVVVSGARL